MPRRRSTVALIPLIHVHHGCALSHKEGSHAFSTESNQAHFFKLCGGQCCYRNLRSRVWWRCLQGGATKAGVVPNKKRIQSASTEGGQGGAHVVERSTGRRRVCDS